MAKNRSKRLRKKLYIGEFTEYGFEYTAELAAPLNREQEEALLDCILRELIEPNQLILGGGVTGGFVARFKSSATDEDRHKLETWFKQRKEYKHVDVSALKNAWYL